MTQTTPNGKALATMDKADSLIAQVQSDQLAIVGVTKQVERMSSAVLALREQLTDDFMRKHVMPLMGTQVGFRTDQGIQGSPYPLAVVRDCAIVCLIRGGRLVNNEFNIIAGNTYFTKEFFTRKLAECEGLTDLRLNFGVPKLVGDKGALVECSATWMVNGVADKIEATIPVKNNAHMGTDALLGKAERKLRARIWSRVNGSDFTVDGEIDDAPEASVAASPSATQASIDALKQQQDGGAKPTAATEKPKAGKPNEPTDADLAGQPPWVAP